MFEILDEIAAAEQSAEDTVSKAREEAEKVRSSFDNEERDALAIAREESSDKLHKRIEAAREEAQKRLRDAAAREPGAGEYMDDHKERVHAAVQRVVELLETPEYQR